MKHLLRRGRRLAAMMTVRGRRALQVLSKSAGPAGTPSRHVASNMDGGLNGKVVLITGSTRGVGLAVAKAFAAQGAKVVINGRTQAGVDRALTLVRTNGAAAIGVVADVGDAEQARTLVAASVEAFGGLDILVNNAGIAGPAGTKAWDVAPDAWRETLRVNVEGPYFCAAAAIKWMMDAKRPGRIINVSSGAGDAAVPDMSAYGVSKVALQGMTRYLAADLDGTGITTVALQLGSLQTDMTKSVFRWEEAELLPSPETVVPAFLQAATAPDELVHGRTMAAWRCLADPQAEALIASPSSIAPALSFPKLKRNGVSVARDSMEVAIYDRGESKFGASPKVAEAIAASLQPKRFAIYPEDRHESLRSALSDQLGLPEDCFFVGNGSSELIHRLLEFFVKPYEKVISNKPGWFGFNMMCSKLGVTTVQVPLMLAGPSNRPHHNLEAVSRAIDSTTRLVYLISPSNPEGIGLRKDEFLAFLETVPPHVPVIVDEAYIEFADDPDVLRANEIVLQTDRTIIGLRTFSKFHGLAALRVGYGFAKPEIAALIDRLGQVFNVSALSEKGAVAALRDLEFQQRTKRQIIDARKHIEAGLTEMGLEYIPSEGPFMLVECPCDVAKLYDRFCSEGIFLAPKTFFSDKYVMFPLSTRELSDTNLSILRSLM